MAMKINRRAILKGMAGAAVSLPLLECMLPARSSTAQGAPARYAILFAGQALGCDNYAKNESRIDGQSVGGARRVEDRPHSQPLLRGDHR